MTDREVAKVRALADSAMRRAQGCYAKYQDFELLVEPVQGAQALNDYFYWIGHANAYKGIVAMAEFATVVEEELDDTPSCP